MRILLFIIILLNPFIVEAGSRSLADMGLGADVRDGVRLVQLIPSEDPRNPTNENLWWTTEEVSITPQGGWVISDQNTYHGITRTGAAVSQAVYRIKARAIGRGSNFLLLQFNSNIDPMKEVYFDLVQGKVGTASEGTMPEIFGPDKDGFYECFMYYTVSQGAVSGRVGIYSAQQDNVPIYTGDGATTSIYVRDISIANSIIPPEGVWPKQDDVWWDKTNVSFNEEGALVNDTTDGGHYIEKLGAVDTKTRYGYVVRAKAGSKDWIRLYYKGKKEKNTGFAFFDLSTGKIGASDGIVDARMQLSTNDFYYCWIEFDVKAGTDVSTLRLDVAEKNDDYAYIGDGTVATYLDGIILVTEYFEIVPTSAQDPTFRDTYWARNETDITGEGGIIPTLNNTEHSLSTNLELQAGDEYTFVAKMKPEANGWVALRIVDDTGPKTTFFNLNDGSIGSSNTTDAGVVGVDPDGYYECWIQQVINNPIAEDDIFVLAANGDGSTQFEGNAIDPSYYIKQIQVLTDVDK